MSGSEELNTEISLSLDLLEEIRCSYTINWVSTKCNLADFPSREHPTSANTSEQRSQALLAMGHFFNIRGGAGSRVPTYW